MLMESTDSTLREAFCCLSRSARLRILDRRTLRDRDKSIASHSDAAKGKFMNYLEMNRAGWNAKTPVHVNSAFYDMPGFLAGNTSLKDLELGLLGDVKGKRVLHLQCHFGQDSLSLARMGAHVTGVDFSDVAIEKATSLAAELQLDATFIHSDVYSLKEHLSGSFDIVFTSYGTIGWLPDLKLWADIVQYFLKPGGQFVMVDFHPVVWMFDERFQSVTYSYFNTGPIVERSEGTYADRDKQPTDDMSSPASKRGHASCARSVLAKPHARSR
jgi:2-polyprenyl-3-methyl-5-hydroxy-6-metoxy-1,4-benzoquinol methylase